MKRFTLLVLCWLLAPTLVLAGGGLFFVQGGGERGMDFFTAMVAGGTNYFLNLGGFAGGQVAESWYGPTPPFELVTPPVGSQWQIEIRYHGKIYGGGSGSIQTRLVAYLDDGSTQVLETKVVQAMSADAKGYTETFKLPARVGMRGVPEFKCSTALVERITVIARPVKVEASR